MTTKKCIIPEDPFVAFFLNCFLHAVILFTILAFFFIFYISRLEEKTFQKEIGSLLQSQISDGFNQLSLDEKQQLTQSLDVIDLVQLQSLYDVPDKTVENNNRWLLTLSYTLIGVSIAFVIILFVVLSFSCKMCISLTKICVENIVIFTLVGAIEICFFLFVAAKYSPVAPSLLTTTLVSSLQKKLL
jgi:hypothetical protein